MHEFKVGDQATAVYYSDRDAGYIEKVEGKRVAFKTGKATLLNGPDSGEPDALTFQQGGFYGHTSGTQRWSIEPDPQRREIWFSWREKRQAYVMCGSDWRTGTTLVPGHRHHYDFNF